MKLITKYILIIIFLAPITAYLDAVLIRGMNFQSYLYVCSWEMMILIIGITIGFKLALKELRGSLK